jgi:hypothetical protein
MVRQGKQDREHGEDHGSRRSAKGKNKFKVRRCRLVLDASLPGD